MSREDVVNAVVQALAVTEPDRVSLRDALLTAIHPMNSPLENQVEALSALGFWMEFVGNERRLSTGADKLKWQFIEGHLESQMRAVDKGIVATMHQNKLAEQQYHHAGR